MALEDCSHRANQSVGVAYWQPVPRSISHPVRSCKRLRLSRPASCRPASTVAGSDRPSRSTTRSRETLATLYPRQENPKRPLNRGAGTSGWKSTAADRFSGGDSLRSLASCSSSEHFVGTAASPPLWFRIRNTDDSPTGLASRVGQDARAGLPGVDAA